MQTKYEYLTIQQLVANFSKSIKVDGEVIQLPEINSYLVQLRAHANLRVNIWFRSGKHQHTNIDGVSLQVADFGIIPGLMDIAERIIARHEYHEGRKAEGA